MRTCVVCCLRPPRGAVLCAECAKAYDRSTAADDGTIAAIIAWAATRARGFSAQARKRRRDAASKEAK